MRRLLLPIPFLFLTAVLLAPPALADAVRVPNVTGREMADAAERLSSADLGVEITWVDDAGVAGRVLDQDPTGGTVVERGSVVRIAVSRPAAAAMAVVPNVVGLAEADARARLGAGFDVEATDVAAAPGQDGHVVQQDPAAGARVAPDSIVRLQIGRAVAAGERVVMPSVVGLDQASVEQTLLDLGLIPVASYAQTRRDPAFHVIAQRPRPGESVRPFTQVLLTIELPSLAPSLVRVPSLYGLSGDQGAAALRALGLTGQVEEVPSRLPPGTVFAQGPLAGAMVPHGALVRARVARDPQPGEAIPRVALANLTSLPLPTAFARIRALGLTAQVRSRLAPDQPVDVVLNQLPQAGHLTVLGQTVALLVPETAQVPALEGQTIADAERLLQTAGLRLAVGGVGRALSSARVRSQAVPAGTTVAAQSSIRVSVLEAVPGGLARVPVLTGLTVRDARDALERSGLSGSFEGPRAVGSVPTRVVSQSPAAGTTLRRGSYVRVIYEVVSIVPSLVVVPDLSGLDGLQAFRRVTLAGLVARPSYVSGGGPRGVTGQYPVPGSRVARGTEVRYTVRH